MEAETPTRHTSRQIARSTAVVMGAFAIAKAVSLAQTFIIARTFGVGSAWDSFVTANRIPELIFTLISGGALAYAFIPVFSGFLSRGDTNGAWRTASHVINTIFSATLVISVIAFFAAPWIVGNLVGSGFPPDVQAQTVGLMRILLLSTLIFSVSGIVMGILQSHNHFLLPALAPIMYDLGILFGVVFLLKPFGVRGIAMGAVLGAALHFLIQVPGLIRFRAHWYPELGWRDPNLWRVIRLMIPRIGGLGVFSFNFVIMNNIASRLGAGSVSALDWGWRLMQIPETLIGTAMGTVIFPTLAALSAVQDDEGKRVAMSGALRFILIATIPSAIGLILIGRPLISLLEGGAFDASASALVYGTLQFFTLGLVVHSLLEVIARSFYADKDTLTPFWAALGGAIINLVLAYVLSGVANIDPSASGDQGNVGGLALANSLGVTFEVVTLLILLRRRWRGVHENEMARTLLKTLAASLVMGLAVVVVNAVWTAAGLADRGFAWTVVQLVVEVGVGGIAFVGAAAVLRMEELTTLLGMILRPHAARKGSDVTLAIKYVTLGIAATNAYLVGDESGQAILIDPVDQAETLVQIAAESGWTIQLILATHAHFDHVLASKALKELTGVPFYIHHEAAEWLKFLPETGVRFTGQPFPEAAVPDRLLTTASETIELGAIKLETLYTPGHAPGHLSFYMRDQGIVFSGDSLFAGTVGRTDLPGSDTATLMRSIRELLLTLPDDTRVLPGHGHPTTIGVERATNPFLT